MAALAAFFWASNSAFSSAIRFSNSEAGSSFGSCDTSVPEEAFFRIDSRSH